MIYRVLGVVSLTVGGIFGLVTLLVLLPFIDNFNASLLVLSGVFGILAYVFLAIGWQLLHPPEERGGRSGEKHAGAEAESTASQPAVPLDASGAARASSTAGPTSPEVEPEAEVAEGGRKESESVPVEGEAASPVPPAGGTEDVGTAAHAPRLSPNGGDSDQAYTAPGRFRKPGAPVPHK